MTISIMLIWVFYMQDLIYINLARIAACRPSANPYTVIAKLAICNIKIFVLPQLISCVLDNCKTVTLSFPGNAMHKKILLVVDCSRTSSNVLEEVVNIPALGATVWVMSTKRSPATLQFERPPETDHA